MDYSISAKKNAYLFILTVGILNTIIALLMYTYFKSTLTQSLYEKNIELAKLEFEKTEDEMQREINHYKLILEVIKKSPHFQKYIRDYSKETEELLIHDFKNFSKTNKNIFQLRYLDKNGEEKIRVDKINEKIVLAQTLQNKSQRYYFTKTASLKNNQFYISDFDLNIENKKIEIPYKPTIRVSTPIYINNEFAGILIINYNAQELIDYISKKRTFDVYYMDKNENFLLHPNKKKSWSSQLNTNYKVEDEITNIHELIKNEFKDKNWIYYIDKVSVTDNDFYIIYSIKKEIYEKELSSLKKNILLVFLIIFLVTLPICSYRLLSTIFSNENFGNFNRRIAFPHSFKKRLGKIYFSK